VNIIDQIEGAIRDCAWHRVSNLVGQARCLQSTDQAPDRTVDIWCVRDPDSSGWLSPLMEAVYSDEPPIAAVRALADLFVFANTNGQIVNAARQIHLIE